MCDLHTRVHASPVHGRTECVLTRLVPPNATHAATATASSHSHALRGLSARSCCRTASPADDGEGPRSGAGCAGADEGPAGAKGGDDGAKLGSEGPGAGRSGGVDDGAGVGGRGDVG